MYAVCNGAQVMFTAYSSLYHLSSSPLFSPPLPSPEPPQVAISAPSIINHTDSLNLNCTVQAGTAPVSVEWSTPRGTFPTNSQSILTLPPGSYSSGEYSCSASNMYGSTSKTVHVNVTVPPLPPSKNWPTQTAHENDTVMLQCQIDRHANPAPSYTWRRLPEGGTPPVLILSQGRFQLTLDHQLRISLVRKEDEGLYECIVENSLGRSVQVVQLQLETPNTPPTPTTGMLFILSILSILSVSLY